MDGGLLSLKWNNHRSTLFYMLSTVRKKECYTDVTLACDGKFYSVHKLVLSMCSEYFEQMFEQTQCKHPVIVLKDIKSEELESLLSYMYVGEVNVVQEKLSGLIKAAECLKIKGLAVPDEEPCSKTSTSREKRSSDNSLNSEPKRRRQDDSGSTSSFRQAHSNNRNDDRRKSLDHPSSSSSNKFRNTNNSNSNVNSNRSSSGDRESGERGSTSYRAERRASPANNNKHQSSAEVKTEEQAETAEPEALEEVVIEEPSQAVKEEPTDADAVYLSDSDSVPDHKDEVLLDSFSDVGQQQHFMDELLGGASESNQGNMGVGDYSEVGEGSSGAGDQQQQHMFGCHETLYHSDASAATSAATSHLDMSVLGEVDHPPSCPVLFPAHPDDSSAGSSQNSGYTSGLFAVSGDDGTTNPYHHSAGTKHRRQFRCRYCHKVFDHKHNFLKHERTHTGEKPYNCRYCSFRNSRSDVLANHVRRIHPEMCVTVPGT